MLIHDFDVFRWILDDEAATRLCDGQRADRSGRGEAPTTSTSTAVAIRTKIGPACADQHESPRRVRLRPALRGAGQQGHAAGGQPRADRGRRVHRRRASRRQARALLPRALSRRVRARDGALLRCARSRASRCARSIDDGVAALALAEAATTSWREKRIVAMSPQLASARSLPEGGVSPGDPRD